LIDVIGLGLMNSKPKPCKDNVDSKMLLEDRPDKYMNETDCLYLDGAYSKTVRDLIELSNEEGKSLSNHNFILPIRKLPKKDLNLSEKKFNEKHSAMRSTIETWFATFDDILDIFIQKMLLFLMMILMLFI